MRRTTPPTTIPVFKLDNDSYAITFETMRTSFYGGNTLRNVGVFLRLISTFTMSEKSV